MSVEWFTAPDAEGAAEACAHRIVSLLETALSSQELATLAVSYTMLRRIPIMPLVTAVIVVIFGSLTVILGLIQYEVRAWD